MGDVIAVRYYGLIAVKSGKAARDHQQRIGDLTRWPCASARRPPSLPPRRHHQHRSHPAGTISTAASGVPRSLPTPPRLRPQRHECHILVVIATWMWHSCRCQPTRRVADGTVGAHAAIGTRIGCARTAATRNDRDLHFKGLWLRRASSASSASQLSRPAGPRSGPATARRAAPGPPAPVATRASPGRNRHRPTPG